ncbi:SDR family oxidoreductase [Yinghuangia sp. ASG 101]|uniref:SDR family NAD(P)-dependent oxidoreductase n=1 Tax=Yinghuangia sp. ASG 101 TaxID=2896848 RepID=UPI001E564C87|nr:SDR family oxidoreductase [Yinghuangia sp. ASG 101]UGQ13708.1 SDR family oxidoreductase [Yinghuangia sp. ASG 101]
MTGGASGIGYATARALRGAGAQVVVADIDAEAGGKAADALGATFALLDVTSPASWDKLVDTVTRFYGGIDIGVLNAGVSGGTPVGSLTDAAYRRIMAINVDGVVFGARALVGPLARRGGGRLVATASLAGLVAMPRDPVYTASKHAVVGFVRALAPDLAERGITVHAVCPGLTDTPLLDGAKAYLEERGMPLLRPEDIAEAVLGCLGSEDTGRAWVVQAGREPIAYTFRGVPGPAGGVRPPEGFGVPGG